MLIYRGGTLPIEKPGIREVTLGERPMTEINVEETVVLPPSSRLRRNEQIRQQLVLLDQTQAARSEVT